MSPSLTTPRFSWQRVRAFGGVFLFSLMLWLFAEGESLSERTLDLDMTILSSSGVDLFVRNIEPPLVGGVTVRLRGPRNALDRAAALLVRGVTLHPGEPGVPSAAGDHTVDLREAVRARDELQRIGVTVASVEPQTVRVSMERLVTWTGVPIRLDAPGLELEGEPVFEPSVATLTAPQALASAIGETPVVFARLAPRDVASLGEGETQSLSVRIVAPAGNPDDPAITVSPARVNVTLTIKTRVETETLPSAPVWVLLPPGEMERWRVTVNPDDLFIEDITLSGPSDLIEQVRARTLPVKAVVELSSDELEQGITEKPASFPLLPPALEVENPSGHVVRFTIEPKQ